jgi:hypothetical protein
VRVKDGTARLAGPNCSHSRSQRRTPPTPPAAPAGRLPAAAPGGPLLDRRRWASIQAAPIQGSGSHSGAATASVAACFPGRAKPSKPRACGSRSPRYRPLLARRRPHIARNSAFFHAEPAGGIRGARSLVATLPPVCAGCWASDVRERRGATITRGLVPVRKQGRRACRARAARPP